MSAAAPSMPATNPARAVDAPSQQAWRHRLVVSHALASHAAAFERFVRGAYRQPKQVDQAIHLGGLLVDRPLYPWLGDVWYKLFCRHRFAAPTRDVRPESDAELVAVFHRVWWVDPVSERRLCRGQYEPLLGTLSAWWPHVARQVERSAYPADPDAARIVAGLAWDGPALNMVRQLFEGMNAPDDLLAKVMSDALQESGVPAECCDPYRYEPDTLTRGDWLFAAADVTGTWGEGSYGTRRYRD